MRAIDPCARVLAVLEEVFVSQKEFEGENEREALGAAARALGVSVEDIDYSLLDEGAEGVFGLGARPARIRVNDVASTPVEEADGEADPTIESMPNRTGPAPEKVEHAREFLSEVLSRMGFNAKLDIADEEERILVTIRDAEGDTSLEDVFKTSRPPVAAALQFITNKVVNRFPEDRKHIVLDAPGPSRKPARTPEGPDGESEFDPELVAVAEFLAEKVKQTGRVFTVHPMMAGDRRAVHQTLLRVHGVRTVSTGEGLYRKMHIAPGKSPSGRRRRRR